MSGTPRRPLGAAVIAAIGVAFTRPATSAIVTIGKPQSETHPDAELIRLCAEVGVHRDRFNESEMDSDRSPHWAAYIQAADAISDAEPQTLAGMVAKAHAAIGEAAGPDDTEEPAGTMAETWAWDLVYDLIRLGGRA